MRSKSVTVPRTLGAGVLAATLVAAAAPVEGCAHEQAPPPQASTAAAAGVEAPQPAPAAGAPVPVDRACAAVKDAYSKFKGLKEGKNADYIPVLARVDPALFGIALVTVDGQVCEAGDVTHPFSIQSIAKVFTAATVMQALGPSAVENKIGVNATGMPFNSIIAIEMNDKHPAGNPLVNPGAIASVGLVPGQDASARWNAISGTMSRAAGRDLTVDAEVYKSESETNTRNQAIATLLKADKVIDGNPTEILDLYTRECSMSVNAHDLATMGATLANGGVRPTTTERVIDAGVATKALALMQITGLYETSGAWAFDVGVPAKSGVGGGILAIVPGRYAVGTFSPPLDGAGNSVRGQKAIAAIVAAIGGNVFDTSAPARSR